MTLLLTRHGGTRAQNARLLPSHRVLAQHNTHVSISGPPGLSLPISYSDRYLTSAVLDTSKQVPQRGRTRIHLAAEWRSASPDHGYELSDSRRELIAPIRILLE